MTGRSVRRCCADLYGCRAGGVVIAYGDGIGERRDGIGSVRGSRWPARLIDMPHYCAEDETLEPTLLAELQRRKLLMMLDEVCRSNSFYRAKLGGPNSPSAAFEIGELPFTTRPEIEEDQLRHPPYGTNLTYPLERYTRLHQTSGSQGQPLRWLDTPESWGRWRVHWGTIFRAAGIDKSDRVAVPFTFGPFIGFWGAFESAAALGHFVMPLGGMTTVARLRHLIEHRATVVCCTPTYALRMIEVASTESIDLAGSSVRALIVAGEPGGSIPSTRMRIEEGFGARVFDHAGMTEMGAWGFECLEAPGGLHIIESEFIGEVIEPGGSSPVPNGSMGELVLTNLGRWCSPLIRYRTGDLVQMVRSRCACGRWFARVVGGILGRADDMLVVRGNNVFPSTIESIVRRFPDIAEFQIIARGEPPLGTLEVVIEPVAGADEAGIVRRLASAVRDECHFQPVVSTGRNLPRFEMKSRRVVRKS